MKHNLTEGNIRKTLIRFAVPYFLACFMQAFYGMADLFITGQFGSAATITAVSIGSQVMHMITVILVGLAMGTAVLLGNAVGAKDERMIGKTLGNSAFLFGLLALITMVGLLVAVNPIVSLMQTPTEAVADTARYLFICFVGIPFIISYNVISSVFRGMGDSKSPMYFVGIACILNIILDYVFIGGCGFGAGGAALGTVISQAVSTMIALIVLKTRKFCSLTKGDFVPQKRVLGKILSVGFPIALQDGLIQVSFLIITMIANRRGLVAAASVGVVEKIISFLFLVPSALLSAIAAITAQNIGADKPERARKTLWYGLAIAVSSGAVFTVLCQICPQVLIGFFSRENNVIVAGTQYLKAYVFDCMFAGIHFCFSGYFCGSRRSYISFLHNIISIIVIRIPGSYYASILFPDTLYPMGWAAPLGSVLSSLICIGFILYERKNWRRAS